MWAVPVHGQGRYAERYRRPLRNHQRRLGSQSPEAQSVYVFGGRNPRVKKVLIREYNRYELTTIRLDEGRFLRPLTDPERVGGKICWSDFVMLAECAASASAVVKYMD